jgi:hypothetical protein
MIGFSYLEPENKVEIQLLLNNNLFNEFAEMDDTPE